jgi:outer membrane receptor protein involved in Fe transport
MQRVSLENSVTRRQRLWVVLGFLVLGLTLRPGVSPAADGSIEGYVRSADSKQAIEGARVSVEGDSARGAVTDAAGFFRLSGLREGHVTLNVRAMGMSAARRTFAIQEDAVSTVDIALTEAPVPMPEVVVTTSREEVKKDEVPANIGVVTEGEIQATHPHHSSEIMGRIPGVLVVDLGGEGHTVAMRQPITYNAVYGYLEDGVPIRSTGFFNHNALYEINIPEASRIEVLKGPATALYGSDAIGGVVNVLTNPPSKLPTIDAFVEGGRYGYGRILASGSNTWSQNALRGDLNLTHFDGWRDDTGQDRVSGTIRHDLRLGENQQLKTVVTTSWIDSPGDGGSDVSRADFESRATVNYTPIAYRKVDALRFSSAYDRTVGPWRTTATAYARHNRLRLLPSWQLTYDPQVWDSWNSSIGLMAQVRRDYGKESWITGGVDMDYSPGHRTEDEIIPNMTGDVFSSYVVGERQYDYDVTFHGISPYAQGAAAMGRKLHLSAGLRFDLLGYNYENHLSELQTGSHRRPASTDVDFDHLSPNAGVTYQFTDRTNLYASYRHGFRIPSEDQLFVQGSATNSLGLKPVRAESYEGGIRTGLGDAARLEVSAYRMDMHDDILYFYNTTDFTSEVSNAGRSRHWGVEAGANGRWRDMKLGASYSYNRHEYIEWMTATGVDYSGNEMESGPRHLGNVRLTFEPPAQPRLSATVEWVHVGRYFTDPENLHSYAGYDLFNLYGVVPVYQTLQFVGRVNNLADIKFANTASYNPFVPVDQSERFLPGQPRSFYLGVQYAWSR